MTDKTHIPSDDATVGVIGGGSWATAITKVLTDNDNTVNWWMRNRDYVDHIKEHHHNPHYLSSTHIDLSKTLVTDDLETVVRESEILVLVIPAAFLQDALSPLSQDDFQDKVIVSGIKGIIPSSNSLVADFCHEEFNLPFEQMIVIAGPSHAEEVASEKLSYVTMACPDTDVAQVIADKVDCRYLKTTVCDDIYGTEYSAVLKNVIALSCGISHGLGYGDNFQAVLISNALQEIKRFIDTVHPIDRDITDWAYLGDLLVTGYSKHSRNRRFGNMIGKGYSVQATEVEMNMIAEGYYAVKSIYEINQDYGADLPIVETVYNILYNDAPPAREIAELAEEMV